MIRKGPPPWYTRTMVYAAWDWARTRWWLLRHPEERRLRAHTARVGISPATFLAQEAVRLGTTTMALKRGGITVRPAADGWELVWPAEWVTATAVITGMRE